MKNIVLVGFMGTGKTAVGKLLAKKLQRSFVDLDAEIEKQAGRSVAEIFSAEGEPGFREREEAAVAKVSLRKNCVIAAGGGVLIREDNVRALRKNGFLVCLTAQTDVIVKRISSPGHVRPLLKGAEPRDRIEELLKERAASYSKADVMVDTSSLSVKEVVDKVAKLL